jgi:hypothetical protein
MQSQEIRPIRRTRLPVGIALDALTLTTTVLLILAFYVPRFSPHASFVLGDSLEQNVPHRVYATQRIQQWQLPEWSDMTFGGYPFLSDPQTAVFFPPFAVMELLGWIPDTSRRFDAVALGFVLAAGLGATALARGLGGGRLGAIGAGVFFALNGYMVNHLSHTVITSAIAAGVWGMFFLALACAHGMPRAWWAAALCLASSVLTGHWQTSMFAWYAATALGLYLVLRETFRGRSLMTGWRNFVGLAFVFVVAGIGTLVQVLPTLEFLKHSTREKLGLSDALAYSLPLKQLAGLLAPAFYQPLVWRVPAENRWELCWSTWGMDGAWEFHFWIGIVAVALMLFGLFAYAKRLSSWLLAAALLFTIVAAMGEDFALYRWLYFHVPGFRQIRIPPRMLWVGYLAGAVLLGRGVDAATRMPRWPWRKWARAGAMLMLLWLLAAIATLLAWALFVTDSWESAVEMLLVINPNFRVGVHRSVEDFLGDIRAAAFVASCFFVASLGWLWLAGRRRSPSRALGLVAVVLMAAELTVYGIYKNIRTDSAGFFSAVTPMHALIGERVVGRLHSFAVGPWEKNTGEASGIPLTTGYNPMILRWTHACFPPEEPTHGWKSRERLLDVYNVTHVAAPSGTCTVELPGLSRRAELTTGTGSVYLAQTSEQLSSTLEISTKGKDLAGVAVVSGAMGVSGEADGTTVGVVSLLGEHGDEITSFALRLGHETAEWTYFDPGLELSPAHVAPPLAFKEGRDLCTSSTAYFLARFDVNTTKPVRTVRIQANLAAPRWLSVAHVIEITSEAQAHVHPAVEGLGYVAVPSRDPRRWIYYRRPSALGWAWLAPEAQPVSYKSSLRWVRQRLDDPAWNPRRTVWVDKKAFATTESLAAHNAQRPADFVGHCEVEHPYPEFWRIRTRGNDRAWLCISNTWYHGWRASVDGRKTPVVRANGPFIAVPVPAGEHVVELRYSTPWLWLGATVSALTWTVALLGLIVGWQPWARLIPKQAAPK